jgi:hypothetical protein
VARARKPFLTPEESQILYQSYVYRTKVQEEQALINTLHKLSKKKHVNYSERFDYNVGYAKLLMIQAMSDQQYQIALEKHVEEQKKFADMLSRHEKFFAKYRDLIKLIFYIIAGILFLLFLSALGL